MLTASPALPHAEYTSAALEHLSARLALLSGPVRRDALAALAARLASAERPRPVRVAAAALTAAALRRDGNGALQVLQQLRTLLEEGKVPTAPTGWRNVSGNGILMRSRLGIINLMGHTDFYKPAVDVFACRVTDHRVHVSTYEEM